MGWFSRRAFGAAGDLPAGDSIGGSCEGLLVHNWIPYAGVVLVAAIGRLDW
jgi:hypothetical protein